MSPSSIPPLGPKGTRLLRVLVEEINRGRIRPGEPRTFIAYSEAIRLMDLRPHGRAGQQLQREGLTELNEWTKTSPGLPKIAGLIVDKKTRRPSHGYPTSHGRVERDWTAWWLRETEKAIAFDWTPYLGRGGTAEASSPSVREDAAAPMPDYRRIITIEPGKRGGRPCIRGLRITVGDILGWLAAGMSEAEIIDDFPELNRTDIHAALAFAADREKQTVSLTVARA